MDIKLKKDKKNNFKIDYNLFIWFLAFLIPVIPIVYSFLYNEVSEMLSNGILLLMAILIFYAICKIKSKDIYLKNNVINIYFEKVYLEIKILLLSLLVFLIDLIYSYTGELSYSNGGNLFSIEIFTFEQTVYLGMIILSAIISYVFIYTCIKHNTLNNVEELKEYFKKNSLYIKALNFYRNNIFIEIKLLFWAASILVCIWWYDEFWFGFDIVEDLLFLCILLCNFVMFYELIRNLAYINKIGLNIFLDKNSLIRYIRSHNRAFNKKSLQIIKNVFIWIKKIFADISKIIFNKSFSVRRYITSFIIIAYVLLTCCIFYMYKKFKITEVFKYYDEQILIVFIAIISLAVIIFIHYFILERDLEILKNMTCRILNGNINNIRNSKKLFFAKEIEDNLNGIEYGLKKTV
uniref:hypothetical protein n=1 Tax=uncultured Clostridium sp. TaxID=59620 RepID=UPI0025E56BE6